MTPSNKNLFKEFRAYHGTDSSKFGSINSYGFWASATEEDMRWLGHGVYFFIEGGLGQPPEEQAMKWAITEAFQKKYRYGCVCYVLIQVPGDEILDLREPNQIRNFHKFRDRYFREAQLDDLSGTERTDGAVIHYIAENLDLAVVVSNLYIQLTANERRYKLRSNISNATVLCVLNGKQSCIQLATLIQLTTFTVS